MAIWQASVNTTMLISTPVAVAGENLYATYGIYAMKHDKVYLKSCAHVARKWLLFQREADTGIFHLDMPIATASLKSSTTNEKPLNIRFF